MLKTIFLFIFSCIAAITGTVKINNAAVHFELIQGNSEYAIILQAGSRSHSAIWQPLVEHLRKTNNTVLAYDRPGLGRSENSNEPRSVESITSELFALIKEVGIMEKKLVLVGHSMGGNYQRYFAQKYPEIVSGLVLIDTPSNQWETQLQSCLTSEQNEERKWRLAESRKSMPKAVQDEYNSAEQTFSQLKNPLDSDIVIGMIYGASQTWPEEYNAHCLSNQWLHNQDSLSKELGALYLWPSYPSGHQVPQEDPAEIFNLIDQIIQKANAKY